MRIPGWLLSGRDIISSILFSSCNCPTFVGTGGGGGGGGGVGGGAHGMGGGDQGMFW